MIVNLIVAIGIGLLIGAERERRKGEGPARSPAGIRTFAITSLLGAISFIVGAELLLAIATAGVIALTVIAYWRGHDDDPGLTTEIALILTVLLGGLSTQQPALAGGLAVVVAVLLASRTRLHRFIRTVLTENELNDILIFAGATLVVLPLIPDRSMGPYGALNPHSIWILVVLVMAISGAGYIAVRMLGTRFGLPVAGLASGFISSTATIAAMGTRAKAGTDVMAAAVAGAVLSTVATIAQLAIVLGATNLPTLRALSISLASAGLTALIYGTIFTILALRQKAGGGGKRRTRVQFHYGSRLCLDPFMHHGCLRRAPGMVRREWDHSGRSACRLRRHAFGGDLGGFARRIGKNDPGRRRAADSRGIFHQYDQQGGSCRHQRGPLVCGPRSPRIDIGRFGGVGGRALWLDWGLNRLSDR